MRVGFLVLVIACGGPSKPTTVENTATPSGTREATDAELVQVIARSSAGGTIETPDPSKPDYQAGMVQAREQMERHCGADFSITQEGEEVVDRHMEPHARSRTPTAWRVHYICGTQK
jgi:hypothetical protein